MSEFEKWFIDQDFYTNMRFIYGENLFHKDLGAYRILPVQMTFKAWSQQQATIDELQKQVGEYEKLTTSIRNEFDLWSDDSEFADVIEAQIENLEALRGEHE